MNTNQLNNDSSLQQDQQQAETSKLDQNEGDAAMNGEGENPEEDQNYTFYKEYCRLYYANIILTNRL